MTAVAEQDTAAQIKAVMDQLDPVEHAVLAPRLQRYLTRRSAIQRFPTPGHLAAFLTPDFVQTPMLDALDELILDAEAGMSRRVIINTPPQEGKSSRMQTAALWLMLRDPTRRIGFASYEQGLAAQSSVAIRQFVEQHGGGYKGQVNAPDHQDELGLLLDPVQAVQTNWRLVDLPFRERPGGVLAAGIGSALTGRALDVLIIDDPIKDQQQADSATWRKRVRDWYQAVALTRLSSNGIVIVVQTRWHREDLTGWLLTEDAKRQFPLWRRVNIPAQAGPNDPLGRKPGEYLASAREGRTDEVWEEIKESVGTRVWQALYQGEPTPPDGGIFKISWFDRHRVATAPALNRITTFIDPADNAGDGDEAGIMTAGLATDGIAYLLEDNSGHYTVAGWVRTALFAMLRHGGSRLAYEQSLSGLRKRVRDEWRIILAQAVALRAAWRSEMGDASWPDRAPATVLDQVAAQFTHETSGPDERAEVRAQLAELWSYTGRVLALPKTGPPLKAVLARGSKSTRAELASPLWENGRFRHVGRFPTLELQMATWLPSQDSPDRMDAVVHLATELGASESPSAPKRPGSGQAVNARATGVPDALRSTRRGR